jgi:hypothetical protein
VQSAEPDASLRFAAVTRFFEEASRTGPVAKHLIAPEDLIAKLVARGSVADTA